MKCPLTRRCVMSCAGIVLVAVAVSMFQYSAMGTDPFTCFIVGISRVSGVQYRWVYTGVNLAVLLVIAIINCAKIGWATPITVFLSGFVTDGFCSLLIVVLPEPGPLMRVTLMCVGIVVMCLGSALYYEADLGVSAYDACPMTISERSGILFKFCRVGTDVLCAVVGALTGATIGVGTLITAFFMGPLISLFSRTVAVPLLRGKPAMSA